MNEHYVINLGRQLGSGGKEIGEKLAQAFGIGPELVFLLSVTELFHTAVA